MPGTTPSTRMEQLLAEPTPPGRPLNNLEKDIATGFSAVLGLGLEHIPADASFFALGGTEAQLPALADAINHELHVRPDPAELAKVPVLSDMAIVVKKLSRASYGHPAPPRQLTDGNPSRHPVFLVAGMGALLKELEVLTAVLSPELRVYGMESAAFDENGRPMHDAVDIAAARVKELRELVGDSPVVLGGHSFGGMVAYEMACQLRDAGHPVAGVLLLDSPPRLGLGREPWTRKRFRVKLRMFTRRHYRRNRRRITLTARRMGFFVPKTEEKRFRYLLDCQNRAFNSFRAKKGYTGKVALITVDSFAKERDEYLTWRDYIASPIELHHVKGVEHRAIVRRKGVGFIAEIANDCLLRMTAPADQPARRP